MNHRRFSLALYIFQRPEPPFVNSKTKPFLRINVNSLTIMQIYNSKITNYALLNENNHKILDYIARNCLNGGCDAFEK